MRFFRVDDCEECPFHECINDVNFKCFENGGIYFYDHGIPASCNLLTMCDIKEIEKELKNERNIECN